MPSYSRIQLENWLKNITVDCDKCLDIGGSQLPIKKRLMNFYAKEYFILDLEEPHECKKKPDYIYDIQDNILKFDLFDIIFCIEVSEYWYNPLKALQNINKLLKKNGFFYFSYHTTYPLHKPTGKDYLRYTYYGIEKLFKKAGFEIIEHKLRKLKFEKKVLDNYLTEFKFDKNDIEKVLSSGGMIKATKI